MYIYIYRSKANTINLPIEDGLYNLFDSGDFGDCLWHCYSTKVYVVRPKLVWFRTTSGNIVCGMFGLWR